MKNEDDFNHKGEKLNISESEQPYDLSVIIVNYHTADFVSRCLTSILLQKDVCYEVILIDNGSKDGIVEIAKNNFSWVKLIENEENLGFARANNQGAKMSGGRYIYYLNPDTQLEIGVFKKLIEYMDTHLEVGLAGTCLINPDGSLQSSVERRYPGQRYAGGELKHLKGDIAWVLGASIIVRRTIVEILNGFDERFFLYGEDLDLCLMVRKAGWHIGFIPDAVVTHWGGGSERKNLPVEVWKKKFKAESVFYTKHYSRKTIDSIKKKNILQACWRILTLKITLLFLKNKKDAMDKLGKYKMALDVFKKI